MPTNPSKHFYFQMNNVTGCASMINNILKQYIFSNSKLLKDNINKIPMHDLFFAVIADEFGIKIFIPNSLVLYRQHDTNVLSAGTGWGFKQIIKKLFSVTDAKISYKKNKIFAKFFADYFKSKLSKTEYNCLITYSKLNEKNKFSRILFLFKNDFFDLGFIRNIRSCIIA